jgi:N-acetylglucosaminyl-diphospho-decaprenol L-rhamnosyltransferase
MRAAIVIPVLNQRAYTQGCLRCLAPDIAAGVAVVVVDNGSTDGTKEWLAGEPGVTVLRNDENRGCAAAWNQGCAAVTEADWVVILNNDVLLPAGWLVALLGAAERHGFDVVCPAMRERDLNYDFASYARDFMEGMHDVVRRGGTHGVCFAVRRAVFARIGGFDEAFRIGQFEDVDFFRRARNAGFRLGSTGACFLHHFGSVTQDALRRRPNARPYEQENRAHYRQKWKLGWLRRRCEKISEGLRAWWWRMTERRCHGHTLHEKWGGDRVLFY